MLSAGDFQDLAYLLIDAHGAGSAGSITRKITNRQPVFLQMRPA